MLAPVLDEDGRIVGIIGIRSAITTPFSSSSVTLVGLFVSSRIVVTPIGAIEDVAACDPFVPDEGRLVADVPVGEVKRVVDVIAVKDLLPRIKERIEEGAGTTELPGARALVVVHLFGPETTISDKTIKIGTTAPLSGPVSAFAQIAKSAEAYFNKVNDEGGIYGRDLVVACVDDMIQRTERAVRAEGGTVAFTNGCFDVIHAGHVSLLERSAAGWAIAATLADGRRRAPRREGSGRDMRLLPCSLKRSKDGRVCMVSI